MANAPDAPETSASAVDAIMKACIGSASSGAPVDTTGLMTFFEWDSKKKALHSLKPLPKMVLLINDNFAIRCSLLAGMDIVDTGVAPAMAKALMGWPRLKREDKPGRLPAFKDDGDTAAGLHKVGVFTDIDGGTWKMQFWDAGLPKP